MKRPSTLLVLSLWSFLASAASAAESTCFVVAVAMNQHPTASEHWNQYGEEFALVFKDHAPPPFRDVQTRTVLGKEARRDNIMSAVAWAMQNAGPEDFVALYFGCHGTTDHKKGWGIDTMDGETVWGKELKEQAGKLACPVLFVIDTCGSGGFANGHEQDVPLPDNCVAICSCGPNQSTSNVLNVALHEALWGTADADNDDFVEVDEAVRYIQMRTKFADPQGRTPNEHETPVFAVGKSVIADMKLTCVSGKLSAIERDGIWRLGRVSGEDGDTRKVHLMGQNDDPSLDFHIFNEAPASHIFPLTDDGPQPVYVKDAATGEARPALVVGKEDERLKVRYVPGAEKDEALVERASISFPFVDATAAP